MGKKIMVSICLITYNHERKIEQAIDSMLEQNVSFSYEIIVGDDCSTDQTAKILKEKYSKKVKLILREKNVGATRNAIGVIKKATGKYLILAEGDDYWALNNTFQYMFDFLECHNKYVGVSVKRWRLNENGKILCDNSNLESTKPILTLNDFLNNDTFDLPATLFKNIFKDEHFLLLMNGSKNRGDLIFCVLILDNGDLYLNDRYLGYYRSVCRKGGNNYNSRNTPWEIYLEAIKLLNNLEKNYKSNYNYWGRYKNETIGVFHYIFEQQNYYCYFCKMIKLLGISRFFGLLFVYFIKFRLKI